MALSIDLCKQSLTSNMPDIGIQTVKITVVESDEKPAATYSTLPAFREHTQAPAGHNGLHYNDNGTYACS